MNLKTQITFFEQKNPITIRRHHEKKTLSRASPAIKRNKNYSEINSHNISSKALDIPDIFSHSIEKSSRKNKIKMPSNNLNISKQRIKHSKSQEKNFIDKNKNIKDFYYFPVNTNFSLSNINYFPHKRNNNKIMLSNSLSIDNNSILRERQQLNNYQNINNANNTYNIKEYKNINKDKISVSLPKIKLNINSLNSRDKLIDKEKLKLNKDNRTKSQRTINNNIYNIQTKIAYNQNDNNNYKILLEDILNDPYLFYQPAKHSQNSFDKIISYGVNTYKGRIRQYNEDRVTILINAAINKNNNKKMNSNSKISLFSIYDGHAGNKCCEYLKTYLHHYIFDSEFFPQNPIKAIEQGFKNCENSFLNLIHSKNKFIDGSGSCAIIVLIINDSCYIINLGDSRALYSSDDGKKFYQLSRDHKPNDPIEKKRIYKAGGNIYKTNLQQVSENVIGFKNKESLINLPYRIYPGRLSVSYFLYYRLLELSVI